MEVTFGDAGLDALESDPAHKCKWDTSLVRAYRRLMRFIRAAVDERDLRAYPGRNFEKLKGNRSHQYSMRLNDQWRLVFEIVRSEPKNVIHVLAIEDYH